jgi:hypothetical protein
MLAPVVPPHILLRVMKPTASVLAFVALSSPLVAGGDFLAPFEHLHLSQRGTPFVHSFGIEPAFTGRDLFLDQTYREGDGFTEHESELELEWAFTQRLGAILEVPYIWEDEKDVATSSGTGDLAIVPRALLVDRECFLLTAQLEVVLPTGSSRFGGETAIAPGVAMWNDLGNWWTLNTNVAVEHGFDEDSTELLFGAGLVKSFGKKADDHADHAHHAHSSAGLLHFHLEATGSTPLNGSDQGDITLEGLVGVSYGITAGLDIRAGYQFPITSPREFDHGFTAGLIIHF